MPTSSRFREITRLTLPILAGMLSGNILSLVDAAMVGVLGDAALAAVGLGSTAMAFAISVVFGLSAAVQAVASRRSGEGAVGRLAEPLNNGLFLALTLGLLFSLVYMALVPLFFKLICDDPAVTQAGIPYLRAALPALPALGLNFAFRGFWQGIGKPMYHLRISILIHASNIALNYLLIFGAWGFPRLGTMGAGIASCLATFIGASAYTWITWRHARTMGFLAARPRAAELRKLLRLAVPVGLQNVFLSLGGLVILTIVALIGTAHLAAANILLRLSRVILFPGIALGFASRTLVGQALGREDGDDAARWGWDVCRICFVTLTLLGLPLLLFPAPILAGFIQEPSTVELAVLPARLIGLFAGLAGMGQVFVYTLQGSGDNRWVMLRAVGVNWFFYLPLAWWLGVQQGYGLIGVFGAQILYGTILFLIFAGRWRSGAWRAHKL